MEKEKEYSYRSVIYVIFILVSVFSVVKTQEHLDNLRRETYKREAEMDIALAMQKQIKEKEFLLLFKKDSLAAKGVDSFKSDSLEFFTLLKNHDENNALDKKKRPVVRYYVKPLDEDKIILLNDHGYYIHERESKRYLKYQSNAIHYGSAVKKHDVLIIAGLLITNGINIQEIEASKYSWKSHSVEIGTDTTILNNTPITLKQLLHNWSDEHEFKD